MNIIGYRVKLLALLCLISQAAAPGWTQNYPTKTVRLILPYSAGSGSDIVGRIIAGGLVEPFGQQVVVENRAGAAGNIGAEIVANAAPDGYTMVLLNITNAANVSLYHQLPFNLLRDFAPVTMVDTSPAVVVVHPSVPVKSFSELVKLAKTRRGMIDYASGGSGTFTFLAAEIFKARAGIDMLHVPYKSGSEALTSVLGGETSVYFAPLATALQFVLQGKLRGLAVTSTQRLPLLQQYPTVAELGYPGYQSGNWHGLAVPAKTPKETIAAIYKAALVELKNPAVIKRLNDLGYVPIGSTPEEFSAHIKSEVDVLGKIIRQFNLSAD